MILRSWPGTIILRCVISLLAKVNRGTASRRVDGCLIGDADRLEVDLTCFRVDVVLQAQDDVATNVRKASFLGNEDDTRGAVALAADQTVRRFEEACRLTSPARDRSAPLPARSELFRVDEGEQRAPESCPSGRGA